MNKKIVMGEEGETTASSFQRNLADYLTFSRIIISLIILLHVFKGEGAYISVMVLTFIGALTDMFDGRAARHYLEEGEEGNLGKYDIVVDTVFFLSIIGYLAFSRIIISPGIGTAWIALVLALGILSKGDQRVLTIAEIISVISILIIALKYRPSLFFFLVVPCFIGGILFEWDRFTQMIFHKWPEMFFKHSNSTTHTT